MMYFLKIQIFTFPPLSVNYQLLATIKFWVLSSIIRQYIGSVDSLPTCRRTSTKLKEQNNQNISCRICRNNINYFLIYEDVFNRKRFPCAPLFLYGAALSPTFRGGEWVAQRLFVVSILCHMSPPPKSWLSQSCQFRITRKVESTFS